MLDLGLSSEAISGNKTQESNETPVFEKNEAVIIDDSPRKRAKIETEEDNRVLMKINEASFLAWLQNFENGVSYIIFQII